MRKTIGISGGIAALMLFVFSLNQDVSGCEDAFPNTAEVSFENLTDIIDKTAKKRRHKDGVGKRIKAFLKDEEVLITAIGTGNVFRNFSYDGVSFHDALYKFGCTPIAHKGELYPR